MIPQESDFFAEFGAAPPVPAVASNAPLDQSSAENFGAFTDPFAERQHVSHS